ncbi:MAG TPA: CYTH domain-containing protein [Candidatus Limnocylindrales bacterium]|nr:CYTH domain-containing protein [Candidatus Limnocylindrales bacterium]
MPADVGPADAAPRPTPTVEVEVKLAVHDSAAIRALLADPDPDRLAGFVADGELVTAEIVDVYLDTAAAGGALRAAGLRARLRVSGSGVVLAVKGRSSVSRDGVTTRMELEAPATPELDAGRWPPSDAQRLVASTVATGTLVEIATLRQRRHVRPVRNATTRVELSLDELAALEAGGGVVATRVELEAELKAGPEAPLAALATALAKVDGLGPPLGSKLEFALRARAER